MTVFSEVSPGRFCESPFKLIGEEWMLITAADGGRANAMTASWGGLGVMWGKNVAYCVIRPQRFTKGLVDAAGRFSLCVLPEELRAAAKYMGSASGRDEDKIKKSGLTLVAGDGVPYFEEARVVFMCKKLYAQRFEKDCFIEQGLCAQWYPQEDYHTLYVSEVEKILVREAGR